MASILCAKAAHISAKSRTICAKAAHMRDKAAHMTAKTAQMIANEGKAAHMTAMTAHMIATAPISERDRAHERRRADLVLQGHAYERQNRAYDR